MSSTVLIVGTLDTKGAEIAFLKNQIAQRGYQTLVMDVGVTGETPFAPEVHGSEVAAAAGEDIQALATGGDRGKAVTAMTRGGERLAQQLYDQGLFQAVISMGGSAGTTMGTAVMRTLPLGVPKVMVSTLASSDVAQFVGVKDIVMMPAIVDISGLNRISRQVFVQAAGAVCGMLEAKLPEGGDKPIVCASMFGNTTTCVELARGGLEDAGYEVLVFHATGTGGRTMESLIEAGYVDGVFDVTTTEWADELVGGVFSAGDTRLEAAARTGTPAVVAPGCLDMVNFWAPETVPEKFKARLLYQHNPSVTLMRTTVEENKELGRILAAKLNLSSGPVAVYLPLRGVSVISAPNEPFHWPEADAALFDAIRENLRSDIVVHEIDAEINDPRFAECMTEGLVELMRTKKQ